jgi:hypothetical protein
MSKRWYPDLDYSQMYMLKGIPVGRTIKVDVLEAYVRPDVWVQHLDANVLSALPCGYKITPEQ